ncbi:MAG: ATPase [Candidatus Diapherotrites archaeon]|nr:ATPase [Candidatus Diapherotrites archaeon]
MKKTKTGIYGLDELIDGGFPTGRTILVSGSCGSGKTTFGIQYIYNGAELYNEPGIYVTLDERPSLLREDCLNFGWDLKELENKNMIRIIDGTVARMGFPTEEEFALPSTGLDIDKLLLEILASIKRFGAKRIVIDSVASLGLTLRTEEDIRRGLLKLNYLLGKAGTTSLLISEIEVDDKRFSKYGVEEYIADGVILMHYIGVGGGITRALQVVKMRGVKHSEYIHPLEITKRGIEVKRIEQADI